MKNATYIGCEGLHSGCESCIEEFHKDHVIRDEFTRRLKTINKECPICFKPIKKDEVEEDDDTGSSVLLLKITCPKCKNWTGKLASHKKHLKKECGKKQSVVSGIVSSVNMAIGNANGGFRVQVKTLEDKVFFFDNMHASDTISSLQQKIKDKEGIDIDKQRYVKLNVKINTYKIYFYVYIESV